MQLLEITSNEFLFTYIAGSIIALIFLGITISTAIRVNKRDRHNRIIIKLLASIAEKSGVEKEFLQKLIDESKI